MTQYWFRPKRYGYGATPITWQGWVVSLGAGIFVGGALTAMNMLVDKSNAVAWLLWATLIATAGWWFTQFCRRHADGEWRWRWGDRANGKSS